MRTIGRHRFTTLLLAVVLAAATGCSGAIVTGPSTPTTPATTTSTFSGTIAQLGADTHVFAVSATGTVQITLTSVAPLSTMSLGVGVMTSDGTSCISTITQNDNARTTGTALQGTAAAGNYCVRVYDSGNVPVGSSADYTVQVTHP